MQLHRAKSRREIRSVPTLICLRSRISASKGSGLSDSSAGNAVTTGNGKRPLAKQINPVKRV